MLPASVDNVFEFHDGSALTDSDVVLQVSGATTDGPGALDTRALEQAFEACYESLLGSALATFETVTLVEERKKRLTTIWLRVRVRSQQDRYFQDGPDEPLLSFLARATLAILGWLNAPSPPLTDLTRSIKALAQVEGAAATLRKTPTSEEIVKAVAALQSARKSIGEAESVRVVMHWGSHELVVPRALPEPELLLVQNTYTSLSNEMILIVESPDYSQSGEWQVRHGKDRLTAIFEESLETRFSRRELDIRPGDAIRCRVYISRSYGFSNELLAERLRVFEILEVLPPEKQEVGYTAVEVSHSETARAANEEFRKPDQQQSENKLGNVAETAPWIDEKAIQTPLEEPGVPLHNEEAVDEAEERMSLLEHLQSGWGTDLRGTRVE